MPPMRVAYFCYYGKNPEGRCILATMSQSGFAGKLDIREVEITVFSVIMRLTATLLAEEYGYEVCVTIPEGYGK